MNEILSNPNFWWVITGAALLGASAAAVGALALLRKQALIGDALAHAALPGLMMAFLLFESRNLSIMLSGAAISAILGLWSINYLTSQTKIKSDSALAIVLSVFFGLGMFLLTRIQKLPIPNQAGLDKFLFGQAAALNPQDLILLTSLSLFCLITITMVFHRIKLTLFDADFARSLGIEVKHYNLLIALLLILTIVIGLQLAGVVLMAAVLLTPMAAARFWSYRLSSLLWLSMGFGVIAASLGSSVSSLAPRMPTGAWIVIMLSVLFFISFFFAPTTGIVAKWRARKALTHRIHEENILRTLYKLDEASTEKGTLYEGETVLKYRNMSLRVLKQTLNRLQKKSLIESIDYRFRLTPTGENKGKKLTIRHRLWELYLIEHVDIAGDHVHDEAEAMEHIINDELEARLREELSQDTLDPHGKVVPQ